MKTLFLDFDGVLHPEGVYVHKDGHIFLGDEYPGHELFEYANLLVELIEQSNVDVQIVLSTSWVHTLKSLEEAKQRLPVKLQEKVVGSTWHSAMDDQVFRGMTRYQQIKSFVERHDISDEDWVAIDDNDNRWNKKLHGNNLVHTDGALGLGDTETQRELILKLKGEMMIKNLVLAHGNMDDAQLCECEYSINFRKATMLIKMPYLSLSLLSAWFGKAYADDVEIAETGIDNAIDLCSKFDVTVQVRDALYHVKAHVLEWGKCEGSVDLELFPLPIELPVSSFQGA